MNLAWKLVPSSDGWVHVALSGSITESAQLGSLLALAGDHPLRMDLSEIEQVNSCGVREWLHFVYQVAARKRPFELVRCPPIFVRQLNMISNFAGDANVRSVLLPYWCQGCGHEDLVELVLPASGTLPEHRPCSECGRAAEFDDIPESYLSFQKQELTHAC